MSVFETKASCSTGSNVLSLDLQSDGNVSQHKTSQENQTEIFSDQEYPFERWDRSAQMKSDGLNECPRYRSVFEVEKWVHQIPSSYKHHVSISRRSSVSETFGTRKECFDASTQTNICRYGTENDKQRNVFSYWFAAIFISCCSMAIISVLTYIVMKMFETQRMLLEENHVCQKELNSLLRDSNHNSAVESLMTHSHQSVRETNDVFQITIILGTILVAAAVTCYFYPSYGINCSASSDHIMFVIWKVLIKLGHWVQQIIIRRLECATQESGDEAINGDTGKTVNIRSNGDGEFSFNDENGDTDRNSPQRKDGLSFDAFISYSNSDSDWVSQLINKSLEYDTQEYAGEVMDGDMHKTTDFRSNGDGEICINEGNDFHIAGDTILGLSDKHPALMKIDLGVDEMISDPSIDRLECEGQENDD